MPNGSVSLVRQTGIVWHTTLWVQIYNNYFVFFIIVAVDVIIA